jgi:putative ABC transport system permease protein
MRGLILQLRYTIRLLLKSPGFTITAILILGLGIGTNTAIFSAIDAVILKPFPYPDPNSLVQIFLTYQGNENSIDYPDYLDICAAQHSLRSLAAVCDSKLDLTGWGTPERVNVDFISASMFEVTGHPFILGRPFTDKEDVPGGPLLVVLSERFWRTRFNADPSIIGKNLTLSDHSFQVVGVVPAQINYWSPCDLYSPINSLELFYSGLRKRDEHPAACFGRLRPGVTFEQARAEIGTIHDSLIARYPDTDKGYGIQVTAPGRGDYTVYDYSPAIWLLGAGVGCLLLISCANIANLLLARAFSHRKEMSVRAALGASRLRLAGQILLETSFLSSLGALLGLAVSLLVIELIKKLSLDSVYRVQSRFQEMNLDAHAFLFVFIVTTLVALLAGIFPAWSLSKTDASSELKENGDRAGTAGPGRQRVQSVLVVGQMALACVLLISAGLLIRSFQAAQNLPLGFDPGNILSVELWLKAKKYLPDDNQRLDQGQKQAFWNAVLEKARQLPGVESAAFNDFPPFYFGDIDWGALTSFRIVGQSDPGPERQLKLDWHTVSSGYFRALHISLLQGRDFGAADDASHERVVIIDEAMANAYFPGESPLGRRIEVTDSEGKKTCTIVGVVAHVRYTRPNNWQRDFQAYFPVAQYNSNYQVLLLRSSGDSGSLTSSIRKLVASVDPDLPVTRIETLDDVINKLYASERISTFVVVLFSAAALFLSAVGLYAVLAYAVGQRTREIGIRIAVGARSTNILQLVIRRGLKLAGIGLLIGVVAALALSRLMGSLLYGVSPNDPLSLIIAILVLGLAALLACLLPALRATRIDPITALRASDQ